MLIFVVGRSQTHQTALLSSGDKERSLITLHQKQTDGCLEDKTVQLLPLFLTQDQSM